MFVGLFTILINRFLYILGSDGIQLDYVNIRTDNRLLNCPLGIKLDDDEFYTVMCSATKNYNKWEAFMWKSKKKYLFQDWPILYLIAYWAGIEIFWNYCLSRTSRVGNSNENKNISVATKCNISLNFLDLNFPRSIGGKVGISREKISNTYPII